MFEFSFVVKHKKPIHRYLFIRIAGNAYPVADSGGGSADIQFFLTSSYYKPLFYLK